MALPLAALLQGDRTHSSRAPPPPHLPKTIPGSAVIIRTVLRSPLGFHGLLLLPPLGVLMEKSVYDTSMALRGIDPNANPEGRHGGGFPSGGHALPSLSLVPLRERALKPRDLVPSALLELFATTTPDDDPGGR